MASWGCPHEIDGKCTHINNIPCDPGMKGCVLSGRYVFINSDAKSARFRNKKLASQSDISGKTEPSKFENNPVK